MKASQYNIMVDHPESGETILFNSLYGSLMVFDHNEIDVVKRILADPVQGDLTDAPLNAVLIEQKYLIEGSVDEVEIVKARKRAGIKDNNRLDVIIMPTLDCNFACPYCYEDHRPSRMTDKTETALKTWLAEEIPKHKVLLLSWFGGEPLIDYKHVLSISHHAVQITRKSGVSCILHMTTNGYLLNKKRIEELLNVEILDFQITVDGSPETHNKLRVLKNGQGTFERIFQNIIDLARADERVKISIRVNFNHTNLESIPKLLEMFPTDVRTQLGMEFEPIFGDCSVSATDNLPAHDISLSLAKYNELAKQLGYGITHGLSSIQTGKLVYCYAERENQYVINYNGDVYKCSVSKFEPSERVGYITPNGIFVKDDEQFDKYVNSKLFEKSCYSCPYLPLCMGGCRSAQLKNQNTGSYCSLVPTNASYLLKQVALGGLQYMLPE